MKLITRKQKEKQVLVSKKNKISYYLSIIEARILNVERRYNAGNLKKEEYDEEIYKKIGKYSYIELKELYQKRVIDFEKRIKKLDESSSKKSIAITATILIIIISLFASSILKDGQITGNVVYSVINPEKQMVLFDLDKSQNITLNPPNTGILNSLAISGNYKGNDTLRISLIIDGEEKQIYSTDSSTTFEKECGAACYLTSQSDSYTLKIEMSNNSRLIIKNIDYLSSELNQFEITPKETTQELKENRFIMGAFKIQNPQNTNLTLAIYSQGELSNYTTIYSPYMEFLENQSEKQLTYEIDLPIGITPGTYQENIIVQYLPKDKFKGDLPKEVYKITVNVQGNRESFSPNKNYLYIIIRILTLTILLNIFFFIMKKKDKIKF